MVDVIFVFKPEHLRRRILAHKISCVTIGAMCDLVSFEYQQT
jgi:hypothetical protein